MGSILFLVGDILVSPAQAAVISVIKLDAHDYHHYFQPGIYYTLEQ